MPNLRFSERDSIDVITLCFLESNSFLVFFLDNSFLVFSLLVALFLVYEENIDRKWFRAFLLTPMKNCTASLPFSILFLRQLYKDFFLFHSS